MSDKNAFLFRRPVFNTDIPGKFMGYQYFTLAQDTITMKFYYTDLNLYDWVKRNHPILRYGDWEREAGITDTNGKTVFEKDIVMARVFDKNKQEYTNKKCAVVWVSSRNGWALYSKDCGIIPDLYFQSKQIEIIGNIHEKD